ncbi:hypothetical protein BH24CHL7_BH24CHL7_15050 [soil metagenome]
MLRLDSHPAEGVAEAAVNYMTTKEAAAVG